MTGPELLVAWRKSHGMTQAEAARLFGVSQAALSEYENCGKTPGVGKLPGVETAIRIAKLTDGAVPVGSWEGARGGET